MATKFTVDGTTLEIEDIGVLSFFQGAFQRRDDSLKEKEQIINSLNDENDALKSELQETKGRVDALEAELQQRKDSAISIQSLQERRHLERIAQSLLPRLDESKLDKMSNRDIKEACIQQRWNIDATNESDEYLNGMFALVDKDSSNFEAQKATMEQPYHRNDDSQLSEWDKWQVEQKELVENAWRIK